ncbi:MAG: hypothetical protein J7K45_04705 [Thaumarchaeota archaeon]|nr:hypothetical protein [Nitrososphaerota archaeon]
MSEEKLEELMKRREEIIERINELSSTLATRLEKREEIYKLKKEARKLWKQIVHLRKTVMKEA